MTPSQFAAILSGRQRGTLAATLRIVLGVAELPYSWLVTRRNRRFDTNPLAARRLEVPVLSVGNLTTGGTGKTPVARWLCAMLIQRGLKPAIVSRGYGARTGANDEALELALSLPGVPQIQNPDRYAGGRQAITGSDVNCIILDDGFQHRRLARDLDIVLLDALAPFGYEHLLPRGFLRESVSGLLRAGVVALSRADLVGPAERRAIRDRVLKVAPGAAWVELRHAPTHWQSLDGRPVPVQTGPHHRVAAFCGIGNPAAFQRTLEQAGCEVAGLREFPDHHPYSSSDIAELQQWAQKLAPLEFLACTMKDLVKIRELQPVGSVPIQALRIEIEVLDGESVFRKRIAAALQHGAADSGIGQR